MYKRILVTGAKGFIGKNLVSELRNRKVFEILEYDKDSTPGELTDFVDKCDFVYHLAGINRPEKTEEFKTGNVDFTTLLLETIRSEGRQVPVIFASSTQATLDNPYGASKLNAERLLETFSEETGTPVITFRLPNVFGKWCRPSYNSVVATFCHKIARDLPVDIHDPNKILKLVYIDDVIKAFTDYLADQAMVPGYRLITDIEPVYTVRLSQLSDMLKSFRASRESRSIPDMSDQFTKKLYSTYLSYLPEDQFNYSLKMNTDARGSFTEFIKTDNCGQISINVSRPGIVKGNHWHHTKLEKFLVVSGIGKIRFRKLGTPEIIEYTVSGEKLEVIDIPVGYTHSIENTGSTEMITIIWSSEIYDPDKPDTYPEEV
jgi:UDP-2-acetamido-2,6-beta-L-arabino-hexul-4-ose reductase